MAKNIVVCLDGTNNQLRAADNTNVVRLFDLLDLKDPSAQVAYYHPGVGTFASPGAWSPPARLMSRYAGLMFGAGLRQNLGEAYSFLMSTYEPDDRIFVFGFSRGAYNARALTGMLDVFGVFRRGSEDLVPYAVSAYAKQERRGRDDPTFFDGLRVYAQTHSVTRSGHTPVHFVGVWDTVKSAGTLTRQLTWPFTRQLPHAHIIRHAVAIDETRRPFAPYLVYRPNPKHILVDQNQDLVEVWFSGVHSDIGGMFAAGTRLSDIALKWMADEAVAQGLRSERSQGECPVRVGIAGRLRNGDRELQVEGNLGEGSLRVEGGGVCGVAEEVSGEIQCRADSCGDRSSRAALPIEVPLSWRADPSSRDRNAGRWLPGRPDALLLDDLCGEQPGCCERR